MRGRSKKHTFTGNIDVRKRELEAALAKIPSGPERERIALQIKELEAAKHMEGWLRSSQLRPPTEI